VLSTRIEDVWSDPVFRRAVRDLLSLDAAQQDRLLSLTEEGFRLEGSPAESFRMSSDQYIFMLGALRSLHSATVEFGLAAVSADVLELMEASRDEFSDVEAETARATLDKLLQPRPKLDEQLKRGRIQRATYPALVDASLMVDLRPSFDGDEAKLVPVVSARLTFDEPIASSGLVLSFQVPDEALAELRRELGGADELIERLRKQFGGSIG